MTNPMHLLAVRSIPSLEPWQSKAGLTTYRTALCLTLTTAGLDMSHVAERPSASFDETKHHALLVWHDLSSDTLRLFAPPCRLLDETTENALGLLDGSTATDLERLPIDDVDAIARVAALLRVGGADAAALHRRFLEPHLERYDEGFEPPSVEDLAELWGRFSPYYVGGSGVRATPLNVWIARAYAFGFAT